MDFFQEEVGQIPSMITIDSPNVTIGASDPQSNITSYEHFGIDVKDRETTLICKVSE